MSDEGMNCTGRAKEGSRKLFLSQDFCYTAPDLTHSPESMTQSTPSYTAMETTAPGLAAHLVQRHQAWLLIWFSGARLGRSFAAPGLAAHLVQRHQAWSLLDMAMAWLLHTRAQPKVESWAKSTVQVQAQSSVSSTGANMSMGLNVLKLRSSNKPKHKRREGLMYECAWPTSSTRPGTRTGLNAVSTHNYRLNA
eukprot:1162035-Pelagomonas_calceolata.AAC.8